MAAEGFRDDGCCGLRDCAGAIRGTTREVCDEPICTLTLKDKCKYRLMVNVSSEKRAREGEGGSVCEREQERG